MKPNFIFAAFPFVLTTAITFATEAQHFSTGSARVSLIELYTSEGCSSCPPAERWLGALRDDPGLWKNFVPVAFHVDYWNRLGWPDRFSTREFTQRQYVQAAAWGTGSVYTPCFVRDGAQWRPNGRLENSDAAAGTLTASYDGAVVRAEFIPVTGTGGPRENVTNYEVHAAILGAGVVSKVAAGENSGETLRHEFIALAFAGGPLDHELVLPMPKIAGVQRHALAVWVTRRGELIPLQTVGGWLAP